MWPPLLDKEKIHDPPYQIREKIMTPPLLKGAMKGGSKLEKLAELYEKLDLKMAKLGKLVLGDMSDSENSKINVKNS